MGIQRAAIHFPPPDWNVKDKENSLTLEYETDFLSIQEATPQNELVHHSLFSTIESQTTLKSGDIN